MKLAEVKQNKGQQTILRNKITYDWNSPIQLAL